MNGFDRIAADDNQWASRPSPLTPEQFIQSLWSEVNALKAAISMPAEDTMTRPWQKTIDFVDGLKGKLPDEELAVIKRYVEKRSREAAQVQVTVTQVNTAQHSSPYPLDPEPSSDVCVNLEKNESKMGPELEELKSPSAGTGQNARTAVSPERGGIGDWTNYRPRHLDRGRGFKPRGKNFNYDGMRGHENVCRHLFDCCDPVKTQAQDIWRRKQAVRPRWKRREGPALERGCNFTFFFWRERGGSLLCFVFSVSALCVSVS